MTVNLPTTSEKCHRTTLWNLFIWLKIVSLQMLVALIRASLWCVILVALKRTDCDVWQIECQASIVTVYLPIKYLKYVLKYKYCHKKILKYKYQSTPEVLKYVFRYSCTYVFVISDLVTGFLLHHISDKNIQSYHWL